MKITSNIIVLLFIVVQRVERASKLTEEVKVKVEVDSESRKMHRESRGLNRGSKF